MVKVLIVDDSRTTRLILKTLLESDPEIEVVGEAENGRQALEKVKELRPDIITMDIQMPVMDGIQAVGQIMRLYPTPILIVTGADEEDSSLSFQAIQKGALDVVEKPRISKGERYAHLKEDLIQKVKNLSRVKVRPVRNKILHPKRQEQYQVVAIGASTGGPRVLLKILRGLPPDYPLPILVVQHITQNFAQVFCRWLDQQISLKVELASSCRTLEGGCVLVAPPKLHMAVSNGKVALRPGSPRHGCIPSVDVLFESLAQEYGKQSVGILLTGMGEDGAEGLLKIQETGGLTIAQDEESCVVFGMPKAAIQRGAAQKVLNPQQIYQTLLWIGMEEED